MYAYLKLALGSGGSSWGWVGVGWWVAVGRAGWLCPAGGPGWGCRFGSAGGGWAGVGLGLGRLRVAGCPLAGFGSRVGSPYFSAAWVAHCMRTSPDYLIHLGRRDKVIVLFQDPLGDLMVLGRTGLDMNKTLNNDPLATLSKNGPDRPETSPTLTGRPCLRAWGVCIVAACQA